MIRPRYAIKLARTKLRSKRGILAASIIVASLLFAALITCVIVFTGAEKSATNFIKKANNDRYLVKVSPVIPNDALRFSTELTLDEVREIKTFEKQYYDNLRAQYKELGLSYDESTQAPALIPASWKSTTLPEEQRVSINWDAPVITALLDKRSSEYTQTATNKFSDLKAIGERYNAHGYYVQRPSGLPGLPNLKLIQNGREDFGSNEMQSGNLSVYGYYINSIHNGQYSFEDQALLGRYLLTKDADSLKGIPVIVSAQEAASLFGKEYGIEAEPENEAQKTAWLKDIQTQLNDHVYQACYRNSTERSMLDKIQQDDAEMTANENNKDYKKPGLLYNYPTTACGAITIKEDTRTATEKESDAKTEEMQKKLGSYVAPEHQILTFQIVGFVNAQPYAEYTSSIENYLKSLIAIEDSRSAVIPLQMYQALPDTMKFDDLIKQTDSLGESAEDFATRVLEFRSIDEARNFIDNETCPSADTDCKKKFAGDPYGSNYLILDEINKLFTKIISIAFPILLGLAIVIIWFTVSRIMAENRKETAIYRAMGAKRCDVAGIYLTYIVLVAGRIAVASLLLGIVAAYLVDYTYGNQLTNIATASFGTITNDLRFNLFDLSSPLLWGITGLIFIASIIAGVQPLIRNVLRPPVQDMRDE